MKSLIALRRAVGLSAVLMAVCVFSVAAQGRLIGVPDNNRDDREMHRPRGRPVDDVRGRGIDDYSGTYYIVNRNGTALHTYLAGTASSTPIVIWNGHGSRYRDDTQAQWHFARQRDGTYIITNVKSGRVIDLPNSSQNSGEVLIIYDRHGADNQRWRVEQNEGDYVSIVSVSSGQAIDVPRYSTQNNTRVIQYGYHRGREQQFRLVPVN